MDSLLLSNNTSGFLLQICQATLWRREEGREEEGGGKGGCMGSCYAMHTAVTLVSSIFASRFSRSFSREAILSLHLFVLLYSQMSVHHLSHPPPLTYPLLHPPIPYPPLTYLLYPLPIPSSSSPFSSLDGHLSFGDGCI